MQRLRPAVVSVLGLAAFLAATYFIAYDHHYNVASAFVATAHAQDAVAVGEQLPTPEPPYVAAEFLQAADVPVNGILMPDAVDPYTPLVATIAHAVPPGDVEVRARWKPGQGVNVMMCGDAAHIWAPPGNHSLAVELTVVVRKDILTIVPDPAAPNDLTKAKTKTVKVIDSWDRFDYARSFTVRGAVPPGPVDPDNPPGPTPDDGKLTPMAKAIRDMLKAIPAGPNGYTKERAVSIADNYATVASQGSDPARSTGWDLEAFRSTTKQLNDQSLPIEVRAEWADPFSKPLANHMAAEFGKRNLTASSREGIAALWDDYGKAIRAAAY